MTYLFVLSEDIWLLMQIDVFDYRVDIEKQGRRIEFDNCRVEKESCFFTRQTFKRRIREVGKEKNYTSVYFIDNFFFLIVYEAFLLFVYNNQAAIDSLAREKEARVNIEKSQTSLSEELGKAQGELQSANQRVTKEMQLELVLLIMV